MPDPLGPPSIGWCFCLRVSGGVSCSLRAVNVGNANYLKKKHVGFLVRFTIFILLRTTHCEEDGFLEFPDLLTIFCPVIYPNALTVHYATMSNVFKSRVSAFDVLVKVASRVYFDFN